MKVALFHTTLPEPGRKPGGVEVVVHRLANALVELGDVEVTVYSLTNAPAYARYRHQRLFPAHSWLRENAIGRLIILPALLNFVSFNSAEVVHLHGDDWFYLRRQRPTIRTIHGSALLEARSARTWKRKVEQYCVYPLERLAVYLSCVSLAIGSSTGRLYPTKQPMDNGVSTEVFRPGPKTRHPQILYVGTWGGRKRGEFLFQVFLREVLPACPEAKLCMVSDYCPEHSSVLYSRFPSDEDLAQFYRESWVFAYPSTYEGFGLAYLEALASGTAVLSSLNEGASHILENGKYGIIAADQDFGTRLKEIITSPETRERLAAAGRGRAEQFSWRNIARRHRTIYRQALNRP